MDKLLYGAAYYDEYMPEERLEKDVEMLQKAHMNVVRIAESTWSTLEPVDGRFDFRSVDRVLDAMYRGGIHVIVGTPTYAVPAWLVKKDPDVLATTKEGRGLYGPRQIMDITNKTFLFHAERVIRQLISHVAAHPAVIGYQIDNETKYYETAGPEVQKAFVKYLQEKFGGDIERVNAAFGLNYWSNAVHDWEDFPDVRNTINASLSGEFEKFQRKLVADYLFWQASIISEYRRSGQFLTHNFDFDWRGYSCGLQPALNHFACGEVLDVAGCDIYHPTQDELTGREISFGGALNYALKGKGYLLLETEAQGFPNWTPYDGQIRLQAFSHIGSGAGMVEYWHWHSLHNACESYWKGVLSHDFSENRVYRECCTVGSDFERLSPKLAGLSKNYEIAFLVSNASLSALRAMKNRGGIVQYNEVLMKWFNALYDMNFECTFVQADENESEKPSDEKAHEEALFEKLKKFRAVFVPALYAASEGTIAAIRRYVSAGGTVISGYKSAFSDENTKIYHDAQPHGLTELFGVNYNQYSIAKGMGLKAETTEAEDLFTGEERIDGFFECLMPCGGEALYSYDHDNWGIYAAAVKNTYGAGRSLYLGCELPDPLLKKLFGCMLSEARVSPVLPDAVFPRIAKKAVSAERKELYFLYNYSGRKQIFTCPEGKFTELLSGAEILGGAEIPLEKWGFAILEKE